uniref:Ovule protein n=1 Tax=Meloidogyne hapla TaxID=6305 RepID=A0A1I8BQ74_MELHA
MSEPIATYGVDDSHTSTHCSPLCMCTPPKVLQKHQQANNNFSNNQHNKFCDVFSIKNGHEKFFKIFKHEVRAMNRIRKRKAESALLDPELQSIGCGIDDVNKSKLMDGQNKDDEDHLSVPVTSDSFQLDLPCYARVLGGQVIEKLAGRK